MKFRIKEARERVGLTQRQLADALNIKPTTFNGYETGAHDPKSEILSQIAVVCRTSVDFLLGLTNIADPINKKSPVPAAPETEDSDDNEDDLFYQALIADGRVREGEDITEAQLRVFADVLDIIDATFPKLPEVESRGSRETG